MSTILFLEQFLNGLQLGMVLFLMAVGVTLVFGVMDVINLSHGSLFMLGGFFLVQAMEWTGSYGFAVILAVVALIAIAILTEFVVIRPLYSRGHLDQVLATYGLILLFNEAVVLIWGRNPLFVSIPKFVSGQVQPFPGVLYPAYRFAITAVAIVLGVLLYVVITRTRIGMLVRAGADKRIMVEAIGVNIDALFTGVFAFGAVLAGIAGMMTAPLISVQTGMGEPVLILTLLVVIIGGIGSVKGALVAALAVGILDTFGRIFLPQLLGAGTGNALANMTVYLLMTCVLVFRPRGLFPGGLG